MAINIRYEIVEASLSFEMFYFIHFDAEKDMPRSGCKIEYHQQRQRKTICFDINFRLNTKGHGDD